MTNGDGNLVGPWVIGVGESEYESFLGSKVKRTWVLEVAYSDQWWWKLDRTLGFRGQGVGKWVQIGFKGQKNIGFRSA